LPILADLHDFRVQSASKFGGLQLNSLRCGTGNFFTEAGIFSERTGNLIDLGMGGAVRLG
jgi:hypothetical protein